VSFAVLGAVSKRLVRFALVVAVLASAQRADALEKVLVLGAEGPPAAGFVEALRIQLAGLATVSTATDLRGTLAQRIDRVGKLLDAQAALLGVWVDEAPPTADGREVHLYIASRRKNRVLVEIARLPALGGPDADRALALKVREVLDSLLTTPMGDDPVVGLEPVRHSSSSAERDPARMVGRFVVEAGGISAATLGGSGGVHTGLTLGVGGRLSLRPASLELIATGQALSALEDHGSAGDAAASELDLGASLRVLTRGATFAGGGRLDAAVRFVEASGSAPDGRTGSVSRVVPVIRLGPELRIELARALSLRAAIAGEVALRRQRFRIDGETVLDLGAARGFGELCLVAALP
jgi:hypothetical protein